MPGSEEDQVVVTSPADWGLAAMTIEESLTQEYMGLVSEYLGKETLSDVVISSIAAAQKFEAEADFLRIVAEVNNAAAASRIATPQQTVDLATRRQTLAVNQFRMRAELQLLGQLQATAIIAAEQEEEGQDQLQLPAACKKQAGLHEAAPRKASTSGALPLIPLVPRLRRTTVLWLRVLKIVGMTGITPTLRYISIVRICVFGSR